jgi:hypothetical protein
VTYTNRVAVFNPTSDLASDTAYTATITIAAKDIAGNAMSSPKIWSFTTGTIIDEIAPLIIAVTPADGAVDVVRNVNVTATFDEFMNPATIDSTSFTLKKGTAIVSGIVSYSGSVAVLNPSADLDANTLYTATITTAVKDLADNPLQVEKTWSFTTGVAKSAGPPPVNLGTAGNFTILSKAGIDTIPSSTVVGDIGVSPAAATYITGFSLGMHSSVTYSTSVQVDGKVYAADYAVPTPAYMTTAIHNMETAYVDAAGRTLPSATELGAGNISGLTIVPGLYKWGTGVLLTSAVTLNGGANDVWIFQIGEGLTFDTGATVILAGGAQAKNIFWQCFGAVTLNTGTHLEGVVLTYTEITLATGATVNGRLLSQTAVTLDQATVAAP